MHPPHTLWAIRRDLLLAGRRQQRYRNTSSDRLTLTHLVDCHTLRFLIPISTNTLPTNLRIISNFFRTAPDGTVRAFSSPIVHERNKNATTAARHMGLPLPERSHALVLGSHEDDVAMTEGTRRDRTRFSSSSLTHSLTQRLPLLPAFRYSN